MKDISECTILIVDDTETNIDILVDTFGEEYDVDTHGLTPVALSK
jgi:putative two-component system response regulator